MANRNEEEELFLNCPIPMRAFIRGLSDGAFEKLHSIVWQELNARADEKINGGDLPPLNEDEKNLLVFASNKIPAIKSYRDRTKCNLMIARKMVERFKENGV